MQEKADNLRCEMRSTRNQLQSEGLTSGNAPVLWSCGRLAIGSGLGRCHLDYIALHGCIYHLRHTRILDLFLLDPLCHSLRAFAIFDTILLSSLAV